MSKAAAGLALGFNPASRIAGLTKPTVWHHMTPLAQKHKAVNLGQGFPGFSPPPFVRAALAAAAEERDGLTYLTNQYARAAGDMSLVKALAAKTGAALGRPVDPITEVMVCNGATGVIFNATQAFLNPGDEVVTFEPAFDIYSAQAAMAGATVRPVPLTLTPGTSQWGFDIDAFRAAFSDKTRMLIFNTPHNPTGKVFTRAEQEAIAEVVKDFPNVVVLADEVYEHLVFDGKEHVSFASLGEDTWQRTLTVSSSGKSFSATGWKVGTYDSDIATWQQLDILLFRPLLHYPNRSSLHSPPLSPLLSRPRARRLGSWSRAPHPTHGHRWLLGVLQRQHSCPGRPFLHPRAGLGPLRGQRDLLRPPGGRLRAQEGQALCRVDGGRPEADRP